MSRIGAYAIWAVLALAAASVVFARARSSRWWQPIALALVVFGSVVAFGIVSWGRATPFGDFNKAYYPAGVAVLTDPSRVYDCEISNACFVNIPIVAALFAPLGWLDRPAAQVVFTIVGLFAVVVAAWMLIGELGATRERRYAIIALVALNGPLLYSARLGNLTHVLLPFLVIAVASLTRGRDGRGGAWLAVLAAIKPPLLLFAPYLLARGRWRAVLAFGGTLAAIAVVSVLWFGVELHAAWIRDLAAPFSERPVAAYNVQSVAGMLAHLLYPEHLTNWEPIDVSPGFKAARYLILAVLGGTAGIAALAAGAPKTREAQWIELNIVLVLTLLASPLTWTHYYAFCVLPLASYAIAVTRDGWRLPAVALTIALVSAPVVLPRFANPLLRALTERVLISHYVFGGILLLCALIVSRWQLRDGRAFGARRGQLEPVAAPVRPQSN